MQRADSMDVDEARMLDDVLGSGVAEKQGALPVLSWKVGIEAPPFVSTNLEAMALPFRRASSRPVTMGGHILRSMSVSASRGSIV